MKSHIVNKKKKVCVDQKIQNSGGIKDFIVTTSFANMSLSSAPLLYAASSRQLTNITQTNKILLFQ